MRYAESNSTDVVEAHQDAALARLVTARVKDAADSMERAARTAASKASVWSDAAALRVEVWKSGDLRDVLVALVLADRALALDPRLPASAFQSGAGSRRSWG